MPLCRDVVDRLRQLVHRQFWSSGNRHFLVSVFYFFDLIFAQMQKPLNERPTMIQEGSRKICLKSI